MTMIIGVNIHVYIYTCMSVLLVDGLQQLECRLNFSFRLGGFHSGAHNGDVLALSRHVMGIGDHAHVDICEETRFMSQ